MLDYLIEIYEDVSNEEVKKLINLFSNTNQQKGYKKLNYIIFT
jgi:hypothetical protein